SLSRTPAKSRGVFFFGNLLLFLGILFVPPLLAHTPFDIRLEVWSNQSFTEPFCSDDPVEIYFRVNQISYITVYQINPWGGVEIIYPLPHHRWQPVYPRRTYRLIDLASDISLRYDGAEGYVQIGIIATPQPVHVVPWLEAGFRECGLVLGRPVSSEYHTRVDFRLVITRIEADLRLRLGPRCVPTFYVAPIYVRPRIAVSPPPIRGWTAPHDTQPPHWRYRDQPDDRPARPEPSKPRSFGRRDFEPPKKNPFDSPRERDSAAAFKPRSSGEQNLEKKPTPNLRKNSDADTSSKNSDRRTKKPRN
ncbi:MAG: DUF4384 domain-containing protein, partial [candidate division KSB1 bacterium]|nr:DUF4384 domain-containing protein [candidate division KSB1 bacterium]